MTQRAGEVVNGALSSSIVLLPEGFSEGRERLHLRLRTPRPGGLLADGWTPQTGLLREVVVLRLHVARHEEPHEVAEPVDRQVPQVGRDAAGQRPAVEVRPVRAGDLRETEGDVVGRSDISLRTASMSCMMCVTSRSSAGSFIRA